MDPSRRNFLKLLLASGAVAATFDVEQLLWVPGQMVTVPAMPVVRGITLEEMNLAAMQVIMPGLTDQFFRTDPLFTHLRDKTRVSVRGKPIVGPRVSPGTVRISGTGRDDQ